MSIDHEISQGYPYDGRPGDDWSLIEWDHEEPLPPDYGIDDIESSESDVPLLNIVASTALSAPPETLQEQPAWERDPKTNDLRAVLGMLEYIPERRKQKAFLDAYAIIKKWPGLEKKLKKELDATGMSLHEYARSMKEEFKRGFMPWTEQLSRVHAMRQAGDSEEDIASYQRKFGNELNNKYYAEEWSPYKEEARLKEIERITGILDSRENTIEQTGLGF